jgi:hypothetical protein
MTSTLTDPIPSPSVAYQELEALSRHLNLEAEDDEDEDAEIDPARVWAWITSLGKPAHKDLAPRVRLHLEAAVNAGEAYDRDVFAEILAGMLGVAALPHLIQAGSVDLGDDKDSFNAVVWPLLDEAPDLAREQLVAAARQPAFLGQAAHLITFLPPKSDASLDIVLSALSHSDEATSEQAAADLRGSDWVKFPEARSRIEQLVTSHTSPAVRAAAATALGE